MIRVDKKIKSKSMIIYLFYTLKSGLNAGSSSHASFRQTFTKSMQFSKSSTGGRNISEQTNFNIS